MRILWLFLVFLVVPAQGESTGELFQAWLLLEPSKRPPLSEQAFAKAALSQREAEIAHHLLWEDLVARERATRAEELKAKVITIDDVSLKFETRVFGEKPEGGHRLFLSMHGGGNTRPAVNDRQWQNQIGLYEPEEGIYLAPRAPTDTWNLWHQSHIDALFDRLIENYVILGEVNPNKIYLMGYSAGGDGVYQLAPRMADRFAAAAMMAGHPNDATPDGLRNIGFTLHMGGNDRAYKRNEVAAEWKKQLATLREADPDGYPHEVIIHEGKGHWMEKEDAVAVPWMATFTRNPHPKRVVWRQSSVLHPRFYWLQVDESQAKKGQRLVASIEGQTVTLEAVPDDLNAVTLLLTDTLLDLDQEVTVRSGDKTCFSGKVPRTLAALSGSLKERADPTQRYWARTTVALR